MPQYTAYIIVAIAVLLGLTGTAPAVAAPPLSQLRTALVIGNAAYGAEVGPLRNPGNDATDMATALRQLGFEVTLVLDATRQRLEEAVETLSRQLRRGGVGLFYFSGHGAQVDGTNYLLPVGARLEKTADVKFQAVAAEWVLASMEEAGNGLNIVILDACRNTPLARQWRSAQRGLAPMQATRGALIAYATAPGSVAADGTGRNGTYTKHLLRYMTIPDLPVEQMFKQVRLAVEQETNGAQTPWELSSLRGDFFFRPDTGARPGPAVPETPGRQEAGGPQVAVGTYPSRSTEPGTSLVGNDGAELVLVPAGEFVMGSDADEIEALLRQYSSLRRERLRDELPRHRAFLDAFYIDKYEVTNARFQQFVQATGYRTDPERDGGGSVYQNGKWEPLNTGETWRTPLGPGSSIEGLANASRPKPNGKKPRAGRPVFSIPGGSCLTVSVSISATATVTPPARTTPLMMTTALALLRGAMRPGRVHMGSMIWRGMSGSGWRTGMTRTTTSTARIGTHQDQPQTPGWSCAVGHGAAVPRASGRPDGLAKFQGSATAMLACGAPRGHKSRVENTLRGESDGAVTDSTGVGRAGI